MKYYKFEYKDNSCSMLLYYVWSIIIESKVVKGDTYEVYM